MGAGWQSLEERSTCGLGEPCFSWQPERGQLVAAAWRKSSDFFRHANQIIGKPMNAHEVQANPFFQFFLQAESMHATAQMTCGACQGTTIT